MTNKEFITKLNKLKNVKTDEQWLASNRSVLLTQISNSGGAELSAWQNFIINFQSLMKTSSRPAFALGTFAVLLIFSGVFSHRLFSQAKPNDSLYIARIISEKAKLGTILDSQERDKLALQFATGHAQDISTVLANPEFNNENNQDQVAKLNANFEKEIKTAQTKISRLALAAPKVDGEDVVMIADSTSTDGRVEISEKPLDNSRPEDPSANIQATEEAPSLDEKASAELIASSSEGVKIEESAKADHVLDEARQSFEKKDYADTLDKLQQVQAMIK